MLHATNQCDCEPGCDCDEVFCGECLDPESSAAIDDAKDRIEQSLTFKALPMWRKQLVKMHDHFCDSATCKGVPAVGDLTDDTDVRAEDCVYCCESVWLLRGFKYGFYIFPKDSELPPPRVNENYEMKEKFNTSIGTDLKKEFKKGWFRLVSWTNYVTPMFVKEEEDKDRIIKDFSKPEEDGINAFADYHRTSYMSVRSAIPYMTAKCFFATVDVVAAFRNIPIHPTHVRFASLRTSAPKIHSARGH